jgi:putative pyruvate formate lyase activating enzyme
MSRYLDNHLRAGLAQKAAAAAAMLEACVLCPRKCAVNRLSGEYGYCRTGRRARVASTAAHFGEEAPLVGTHGSGTIFFTHCNLGCIFCQNYDISHGGEGRPVEDDQLATMMMTLQAAGCHNINLVTPSHVVPQILSALAIAADRGLTIPLVYNSGGYDSVETLRLLDGVVDIYMPDFKFWDEAVANRLCQAADYRRKACRALTEMHRQVGDLEVNEAGLAVSGLIVRHLVMPKGLAGTADVMRFIATKISAETFVNIMPQYRPMGNIASEPALSAPISEEDYAEALAAAKSAGIHRLDRCRNMFGIV